MKLRRRIASRDFTENMMPHTRKEVFFDVWKMHWFDLLKLGFVLLIAFLPVLMMTVTKDAYEAKMMAEIEVNASQETLKELQISVLMFRSTSAFIQVPLYMLFAIVLSGALRLVRQQTGLPLYGRAGILRPLRPESFAAVGRTRPQPWPCGGRVYEL